VPAAQLVQLVDRPLPAYVPAGQDAHFMVEESITTNFPATQSRQVEAPVSVW